MNMREFLALAIWLMKEARSFTPMKLYRLVRGLSGRPRPFPVQFKTQRKMPPAKAPSYIDEGALNVPFSALDNHGIIASGTARLATSQKKVETTVKEKIKLSSVPAQPKAEARPEPEPAPPAQADDGKQLHAAFLRQTVESAERRDPAFPQLDCADLHYRISILGIRNGHMHLLGKNSLGKTFKTTVHGMFDTQGRLKVKGLAVRVPLENQGQEEPVYHAAGSIDLTGYVGLNAHTLAQLEDAINEGLVRLRREGTEKASAPAPEAKPASTLSILQNIRSALTRPANDERRSYADRRAGDDRRLIERRDEDERRSGIDRRKAREEKVKDFMVVKDEEYRKKERRSGQRRSGVDRRTHTERRAVGERRFDLHIPVHRSQYLRGEHGSLLAFIADSCTIGGKDEGSEVVLNPRSDFPSVDLLFHASGRLLLQAGKGKPHETFLVPHMGVAMVIRAPTDTGVHLSATGKGHLLFKPKKKTGARLVFHLPPAMLPSAIVEIQPKGRRKLVFGLLTVEISRLHKKCMLMLPGGESYPLDNADDIRALNEVIRALARGSAQGAG